MSPPCNFKTMHTGINATSKQATTKWNREHPRANPSSGNWGQQTLCISDLPLAPHVAKRTVSRIFVGTYMISRCKGVRLPYAYRYSDDCWSLEA